MERCRQLAPISGAGGRPSLFPSRSRDGFVMSWATKLMGKNLFQNFFSFVASSASFWRKWVLSATWLTLHDMISLSLLTCMASALKLPNCKLQPQPCNKPWRQVGDQMNWNHHFLILGVVYFRNILADGPTSKRLRVHRHHCR